MWKDFFKVIGIIILIMVVCACLGFVSDSLNFMSYKFWAPRQEQVRHDTFKQGQAYNDGVAIELNKLYMEYQQATDSQKSTIQQVVLHQTANYPVNKLPNYLQVWIGELHNVQKY